MEADMIETIVVTVEPPQPAVVSVGLPGPPGSAGPPGPPGPPGPIGGGVDEMADLGLWFENQLQGSGA